MIFLGVLSVFLAPADETSRASEDTTNEVAQPLPDTLPIPNQTPMMQQAFARPPIQITILDYLAPDFCHKTYPLEPFGVVTTVCKQYHTFAHPYLLALDHKVKAMLEWQPEKMLRSPPKTEEEAVKVGMELFVGIRGKILTRVALHEILSCKTGRRQPPTRRQFSTRINSTLLAELNCNLIGLPDDSFDALRTAIPDDMIYRTVEEAFFRLESVDRGGRKNLQQLKDIAENPGKYKSELEEYTDFTFIGKLELYIKGHNNCGARSEDIKEMHTKYLQRQPQKTSTASSSDMRSYQKA